MDCWWPANQWSSAIDVKRLVLSTTAFAASFTNRVAAGTLKFGADLDQRPAADWASWSAGFFGFLFVVLVRHNVLKSQMESIVELRTH